MFNFYNSKCRWLRTLSVAVFFVLVGSGGAFAQTTYYSKAASTDFTSTASWGTNTDGTGTAPGSISNADNFIIQNGSVMNLNSGSAAVRNLTINAGSLTVGSNTLTVALPTGNNAGLSLASTAVMTVSGSGAVVVNGYIATAGSSQLVQSGGNITVDGNDAGSAATSVPSGTYIFSVASSNTTPLNFTGGTFTIVDPHYTTTYTVYYNASVGHSNIGTSHTFRFGNGSSTDAGGSNGFYMNTWVGSYRIAFGNVVCDLATGTNRFVNSIYSYGILGNLTVTSGDYRIATVTYIAGNITNNGTLTTTSTLQFANFISGSASAATVAQTVSGSGVFRNSTSASTANFASVTVNNTHASGVTFSSAASVLSGANTGTVSGTLTFTSGIVNATGGTFILGISPASAGTLTPTNGGFGSGSTFRRWLTTSTLTTSATPTPGTASHRAFPFVVGTAARTVLMTKSGNFSSGGWIEATHTSAAGLAAAGFLDGGYSVDQRTNASWTFNSGGGINLGANTLVAGLGAEGLIVTAAAPGTAPRFVQAAAAAKTHLNGVGTSAAPYGCRTALVLADLAAGPHYVGIANADIGLYSVNSTAWNLGSTWSTGVVPTAAQSPLITSGTTVTVNAAGAVALGVTVGGTLNISSGDLTVVGASASGITVNTGANLNVNGGTLNLQDGTNNNRRLISNGTLNVSSGNLNIDGNLNVTSTGFFTQSGGTITIDGNGTTTSSVQDLALFQQPPTNFNVTGGNLTFVDPPPTALNTVGYDSPSGDAVWGAGHVTTFGDGVSTAAGNATNGFRINTWISSAYLHMGSFVLNGASGSNRFLTHAYTNLPFTGNFTVNAGSDARVAALWVGGNVVNNGSLVTTTSLNMANYRYNGGITDVTSAQSIGGSGTYANLLASPTANVAILRVQNSSVGGITLNIPFTMSGQLQMINGKLNTTSTNILTMYSATGNVGIGGAATSSYVNGPMVRRMPASTAFNSFFAIMPVGKTGPNYFTVNASTSAAGYVDFRAECFNANAGTFDGSLTSLNAGRRWETSISGPGVMTSYAVTIYDGNAVTGNAIAATPAYPGTDFAVVGNGANWTAGTAPLPNTLSMSTNEVTGTMPAAFGFGNTGPINVTLGLGTQVTGNVSVGSTLNDVTRIGITAVGSSGTVTLTDLVYTYTGSNAADVAVNGVTLWTGTITAPVAQVGSAVSLSGGFATWSGLSVNIASGSTFLWVRMNTSATATIGNTLDGKVELGNMAFTVSGGATVLGAAPGVNPFPAADLDPAGNRLIDYCQAVFTNACTSNDILTAFSINTLSSTPNCPGAAPTNYGKLVATTTLQQGNAYTANFTTGSGGAQGVAIWFDFNHDGDFADAGEFFGTAGTTAANTAGSLNITVDPSALTGLTRMRVMNRWNTTFAQGNVCLNPINYGTTVDYDVTITSPSPRALGTIALVQQTQGMGISTTNNNLLRVELPTTGSLGTLTLTQIRFTYTGTSAADIAASGATLWTGTVSAPSTQIGSATSFGPTANFTGLSVALGATNYLWLRVNTSASAVIANLVDAKIVAGDITINAAGGATAPGSQPPSDLDPAGSAFIDYCAPTYGVGCGFGDDITNVTLVGSGTPLNNSSACTPNPYYTFYSAVPAPSLYQGSTYPISVQVGTDGTQWVGAWIDFDQDGLLETTEYFEKTSVTGGSGTATFNIVVPITATLGNTRMRIRGGNDARILNTQACGASSSGYGESEDYIVTIIPPPNCSTLLPFPATAATTTSTTVCSGSSVLFGITVPMPSGTGITYQWRRNGTNIGAPVATATNSITVTAGGNYDVVISCNGTPQVTSSAIAITVFTPTVTGTTPGTRCGAGTVTVSATGSGGTTIKWYDVPTGGSALTSGGSYVTPSLGVGVHPYYASATQVFATENGGKAAFTPGTGFITTDWGIVFTATRDIVINTVDIYPDGTGDVVIGLYASDATTLLAESPSIPVSGSLTVQTVPLGFDVPAGANYRLLIKSYNGITGLGRDAGTFPNNSPSGALSVTASEWGGTTTTNNYFFYNLNVSSICASPRTLVNATVNNPPSLNVSPVGSPTFCSGGSVGGVASGFGYTTYNWAPATGVSPAGPGANKTLNPTVTTTYTVTATGGGCNNTQTMTVYVKPVPTSPTITPVPVGGICIGATKSMSTSATAGGNLQLFSGDFNDGTLGGFTLASGGVSPTNWQLQTTPLTYTTQITSYSVSTPASPFVWINSDVLGSGSSAGFAHLISPSFSTTGYSGLTLSFDHVYRTVGSNIEAYVQYSLDGGLTWAPTKLYSTTATTPAQVWNAASIVSTTQVVTLPAACNNKPSVKLRFTCEYDWDYYWMVDNIQVYVPATVEYRWSSSNANAGIPVPAQSYSSSNASVVATPIAGGVMPYQVEVRNSVGCNSLAVGTHSTNVSEIIIAPSNSGPQRENTLVTINAPVATGGFGGYTYQWYKLPDMVTVINNNPTWTIPSGTVANSGTYHVVVTDGQGCSVNGNTDLLVYAALVWNGSQSSSWTDPLNWTPPIVPANDCNENVVITSLGTAPVFPGPAQNVGNFALETGSTLSLTNDLNICGSLTGASLGTSYVTGTGTMTLTGTGNVVVGGTANLDRLVINRTSGSVTFTGTTRISDLLTISNSNAAIAVAGSGKVVLQSGPSGTARVGQVPAGTAISVTNPGGFIMERYLPFTVPGTGSNGQWFFMGSPMAGKNFTDWSDNFRTVGLSTGFGGQGGDIIPSQEPERSTIFKYLDANHFTVPSDTVSKYGWVIPGGGDQIVRGTGYRVYVQRYGSSSDRFDNKGLFGFGDFNFPTLNRVEMADCFETTNPGIVTPCTEDWRGWNFLANPYPSPIDWDAAGAAWTKPGTMLNGWYRWISNAPGLGGYGLYTNGGGYVGAGPAPANPNLIPSSQAFFVKLTSAGSATLTVRELAKSSSAATFARVAAVSNQLRISLEKPELNGSYNFSGVVRFRDDATDGSDAQLDFPIMSSEQFQFNMPVEGASLIINSLAPLNTTKTVPVKTLFKGSYGVHEFRFSGIESFDAGSMMYLRDNYLNTVTDIVANPVYSFEVTAQNIGMTDRFELVFTPESTTSVLGGKTGLGLSIYPNPSTSGKGAIIAMSGINATTAEVTITDALGRVVFSTNVALNPESTTEYNLTEKLSAGVYTVKTSGGNKTLTQKMVIK